MSRALRTKLRRDLWRQKWQFTAVALVIAIGVAVYVAASDSHRNLGDSFDHAYATQRLPDVILSGPNAFTVRRAAGRLPGSPAVTRRLQGDLGVRIAGRAFFGRAVGLPQAGQPGVSRLAMQSGRLPAAGEVVVEQHLADHYGLRPGDTVRLKGPSGWKTWTVSGSALSTEYFWPARSPQEMVTTPEHFGVVFIPAPQIGAELAAPVEQLVLYAEDRGSADELAAAAERFADSHGLLFVDRDQQPSYRLLDDDVEAVGNFSRLFPWVFLVAAVLGTYVLLSRLVVAQRALIGTLVANGISTGAVRRHYLGYGVAAGILGAVPGMVGGYFLADWFTRLYTDALGLPLSVTSIHVDSLLMGAAVGVAAASIAAWVPARTASRTMPAEAMRITPPGVRGRVTLLEVVAPVVRRLPARWRMVLRGITRNRRRTLLTAAGVAVTVSLVLVFAALRDTVGGTIDRQYQAIQLEDAQVLTTSESSRSFLKTARNDTDVADAEPFGHHDTTLSNGHKTQETIVLALRRDTQMHQFFTTSGEGRRLPARGVFLGEGNRKTLGLSVGDKVTITMAATGQRFREPVLAFVDEPLAGGFISIGHLEQRTRSPAATGVMLRLTRGADESVVSKRLNAVPGVVAYLSTNTLEMSMRDTFSYYDTMVGVMLLFAALMAAALLFTAMSANVAERSVELGTLEAGGMGSGVLGRLAASENLILVVFGIPFGVFGGVQLAEYFISTYEVAGYQWVLHMETATPVVVAALVFTAALAAQGPGVAMIRHLDVPKIVRERSL